MAKQNAKKFYDTAAGLDTVDPNTLKAQEMGNPRPLARVSMGDRTAEPKTTGIKMRGSGAATKGFMSRGPMA